MSIYRTLLFTISLLSSQQVLAAPSQQQGKPDRSKIKLPPSQPTEEPNAVEAGDKVFDKTLLDDVHLHAKNGEKTWHFAAGVNMAWSVRQDYGTRDFRRFEPEAVGYIYTPLQWSHVWLRHGARLSYSKDQPQMPKSVRIEESDWKISIEEGLIWSWYVAPSITAGVGYDMRTVKVKTSSPIKSSDSRLNSNESFIWSYLQAGLGLPALQGEYEFQPVLRWQNLVNDTRTNWAFGFEISKAW